MLNDFSTIYTALGTTGFLIFIIWQLLNRFVFTKKETSLDDLEAHVMKLETNHLAHIADDVRRIETNVEKIQETLIVQGNRITKIETKLDI